MPVYMPDFDVYVGRRPPTYTDGPTGGFQMGDRWVDIGSRYLYLFLGSQTNYSNWAKIKISNELWVQQLIEQVNLIQGKCVLVGNQWADTTNISISTDTPPPTATPFKTDY